MIGHRDGDHFDALVSDGVRAVRQVTDSARRHKGHVDGEAVVEVEEGEFRVASDAVVDVHGHSRHRVGVDGQRGEEQLARRKHAKIRGGEGGGGGGGGRRGGGGGGEGGVGGGRGHISTAQ